MRSCYERALGNNPHLSGRVTVRFVISEAGVVLRAEITNSTIREESIKSCILAAVKRWTFPQPQGGGVVVVTYPFHFDLR